MPVVRVIMEELVFMVGGWVNFPVSAVLKLQSYHLSTIHAMLVSELMFIGVVVFIQMLQKLFTCISEHLTGYRAGRKKRSVQIIAL